MKRTEKTRKKRSRLVLRLIVIVLASLFVGAMFMIGVVVLGQLGHFHMSVGHLAAMYIITAIITAEMYFRHRENIKRLLNHTERKTYIFKKNKH
jgi:glycerol-3-phosphate acyltransferase PlsY